MFLLQTGTGDTDIDVGLGAIWRTIDSLLDGFMALIPNLVIAIVVLILFFILGKFVRSGVRRTTTHFESANLGMVLGRLAQSAISLLGLLVAVAIVAPSVKPATLLNLLGVSSIAIGFAFKDILQNFLAGILILLRQPFRVGDEIIFQSFEGTVETIDTRATLLKTYDGRRVVIPNGELYTNSVIVNTAHKARRTEYMVGIGYGDDVRTAANGVLETLRQVEGVLRDPAPDVLVMELAGSSVNIRARWWTDPHRKDVLAVQDRVITEIRYKMNELGIDLPFPTQVVLFHDQTEETDGDRARQREGWPAGDDPPKPRNLPRVLETLRDAKAGVSSGGDGSHSDGTA